MTWWLYSKQIQIPGHSWPTCDMGIDSKGTVNVTLSVYSTWTYMYILYSICVQSLVGRNCLQSKGIMCWYHQYNYLWLGLVHATLSFVKTPGIDSLEGFCRQIYHHGKPYHTFAVCLFHIACQLHSTWHGWGISRLINAKSCVKQSPCEKNPNKGDLYWRDFHSPTLHPKIITTFEIQPLLNENQEGSDTRRLWNNGRCLHNIQRPPKNPTLKFDYRWSTGQVSKWPICLINIQTRKPKHQHDPTSQCTFRIKKHFLGMV